MIRDMKKQLRGWRAEINARWGRLTSFHRTALGIMLSVLIILAARNAWLDPLRKELEKKTEALSAKGVPAQVAPPEADKDIQELLVRIESMEPALASARASLQQTIEKRSPLRFEQKSEAVAETYRLITQAGLRVKSFTEAARDTARQDNGPAAEPPDRKQGKKRQGKKQPAPETPVEPAQEQAAKQRESVLPVAEQAYVLEGDFDGVFRFLHLMNAFPWPCSLCEVDIAAATDGDGAIVAFNGRPMLRLSFLHRLYFYDYDQNR